MLYGKCLALTLAALLVVSSVSLAIPVDAQQQHIRTMITLGLKKDNSSGEVTGSPDNAVPTLVRVGETHLIYGRLMQLPDGKNLQPLPDKEVKLIDVFNNAQRPVVIATAKSDKEGYFVFEWKVSVKQFKQIGVFKIQEGITSLENLRLQVLGVFEGDSSYAKSTSRGYIVNLKPLTFNVNVKTDKTLYTAGESAKVTITFKNPQGQPIDPDKLEVFFGSSRMSPVRQDVGVYFFTTPPLTENIHKVTVLADKEEFMQQLTSATITASAKVDALVNVDVSTDQKAYGLSDPVVISGSVRPVLEGRLILINVINPNGSVFNFGRVLPNPDGSFKHEFSLVGQLAVTGEWTATYTYLGTQVTESFTVGELPTKFLEVEVQSSSVVNDLGEPLEEVTLASPVGIQTELVNNESKSISLTYIVQVTDSEGFTVMLSWIKGITLKPSASMKPAIFWYPESKGNFNVEIFAWESLENPMPLSAPKTLEISVA